MFPITPVYYGVDCRSSNLITRPELPHEYAAQRVSFADFSNLFLRKTGATVIFSAGDIFGMLMDWITVALTRSSFCRHVRLVVLYRSEEQVIGPDTSADVATVQYPKSGRNGAVIQNPRGAMRPCGTLGVFSEADYPVSVRVNVGRPKPTGFCLTDLRPESFGERPLLMR